MIKYRYGRMAELVDAPDSKSSSSNGVRVRFPLRPPFINVVDTGSGIWLSRDSLFAHHLFFEELSEV